jgi:hypothetical protein
LVGIVDTGQVIRHGQKQAASCEDDPTSKPTEFDISYLYDAMSYTAFDGSAYVTFFCYTFIGSIEDAGYIPPRSANVMKGSLSVK